MRAQLCAGVYREIDYFVYDLTSTICNQINHAVKISNRQKQIMLSRSQIDENKSCCQDLKLAGVRWLH
jgi:hypothetical protein